MCGRYVTVSSPEALAERFDVDDVTVGALPQRWNVAPTLDVPAVLQRDGQRALGTLRWGFVPFWSKSLRKGPRPINVRVESVHEKRMFTQSFERRRCILPADGFYEWQQREGSDRKQPWYFHDPDEQPLAFAGIWGTWRNREPGPDEPEVVHSCAIVTTAAAGRMADVHERMPVVLPRTLWDTWLDAEPHDAPHLQEVVARAGTPPLRAREITDRVNNVRNEGPELLEAGTVA